MYYFEVYLNFSVKITVFKIINEFISFRKKNYIQIYKSLIIILYKKRQRGLQTFGFLSLSALIEMRASRATSYNRAVHAPCKYIHVPGY